MKQYLHNIFYLLLGLVMLSASTRVDTFISPKQHVIAVFDTDGVKQEASEQTNTSDDATNQTQDKKDTSPSFEKYKDVKATLQIVFPLFGNFLAVLPNGIWVDSPLLKSLALESGYRFSTSLFFKTLYRCFIAPNAP